ncbi:hypothetical protein FJZ31_40145 [Candidatus Poribacteria bacterium]|nr:hypothetical protein [Candidatus Poribacteria bacterium]
MLNIKKSITVSEILIHNLISLSLFLALFCLSGHLHAQTPPALDFPPGRELDPRHLGVLGEKGLVPSAISENVEFVGATGGAVEDVFVQGNYAYLCAYGVLVILDISAPANPTKVGNIDLPDVAEGVYVSGSYAYVADCYSGLLVIDVSSPENPFEVGFYDTPDYASGVYVSGSYAYVADCYSGLRVIDVSSPSNPREVGFYDTPGSASGVYVSGSYAYVADSLSGLRIIDVSSPSKPKEVGFYDTPNQAYGVYVSGSLAYVADGESGLRIIDVSSPSKPKGVGFYDTPGWAQGVYVSGSYAYVADRDYGLRIIDVSSPSKPKEVGFYDTPASAHGVYVSGSYAYVADCDYGLRVIDISFPSNPREVGFYDAPGYALGVCVSGSYAYVADAREGLRVIDVSSPSNPREVGFYGTPDSAQGVYVSGSYAYVADGSSGLRVIDVSSPSNPREVGFYNTPDAALDVYIPGSLAYVADGESGLRIIDVSSPSKPKGVGFYDTPGYAFGVYVSGSYAYVADYYNGLRVIDVSSPSNPREVGFYDTPGEALGVYVSESYAYVADWFSGLRVIDVSSPENPFEVGFYDTPGYALGVYVSGSYAYVADSGSGLRVIDISSPENPREVGFYDTTGASGVYVSGGLIYVAGSSRGLYILRYTGGVPDTIPPSAITDLATSNPTPDSITLTWTAPGDDGDVGLASQYDIRYSTSLINEGNWGSATQAVGEPAPSPAGTAEIFIVTGLSPDTTYYFAMKTADEVPNWSDLSNVAFGSKLSLNDIVGVNGTGDDGLSLRDDYGLSSKKLKVVPDGWTFRIINGVPIPADGYIWWQVREEKYETSPIDGWVAENWLTKVSPENLVPPDVPDYFSSNQDKIEAAITWAISQEGKTDWAGWCLKFVANAFGRANSGYQNPNEMKEALGDEFYSWTECWNLPRGALIFFSALGEYVEEGHIGIYLGDQGVVHSYDKVRVDKEDSGVNKGIVIVENLSLIDSYIGWAYPPKDWIDNTSPSAIANLATSNPTPDSITLTWTAPGDDGDVGLASQYDIRYSTSLINEGNWDSATQAVGEPKPKLAGSAESFVVTGLSPGTTYYFAIKTADEVPNWSGLSNVAKGTTQLVSPILLSPPDGSVIDTPTVELKWGAVVGATSYTVQYSTDQAFPPISEKTVTLTGLPTTNYTIPLQSIGAQVYWRAKGVKSGAESAWSEVWDFKATYAESAVTSAVIDRPTNGESFKQWTETTARAYFTGTYEGEITGKWWLDGAPWKDFTVTMTKGKRTEVESPFLPTDVVDSTHNIQNRVETPSPLDSTIISYNVVAGDWGPPAQLTIRAEPSIILTKGDTSTLTAIVKDAENRTVLSYDDIVTFAILVGPGILQGDPVVTAQNGEAQIVLASTETAGLVRIGAQIPADYSVPGAEVKVTTTSDDVQQYLQRIQEYIDRLKNLEIEVPSWPSTPLSESYDLSGVEEFLDTKIRPPNNPTPAEIEALKRLTFALEAIDHAYYHRFDPSKIDHDREVLGEMTIADDITDSAVQILLVGLGAIAKIEGLAGDIPILRYIVRKVGKLILGIVEDVLNDGINQIPDEAYRNILSMGMKAIFFDLKANLDLGKSLAELLADVGIRIPADDLILSDYVEKSQYLINKAVEFANNPDSITSTTKVAEAKVYEYIEKIRGKTDVTHEIIETLKFNANIANTVGDIALATGIGTVVGIVTKVMAGIELGYGIVDGAITFYYEVPSYLENAVLLAFQPDKPVQIYQPPALVAHNRRGVKSPLPPFLKGGKPDVTRYQKYLQMATTGGDDFETILAQIVAAVEADDTEAVQELLPQLVEADDDLSVSHDMAFSPLVAAHENATNIVAGFAEAYDTTSTTKQDSSGQRGLLYSNLLDYLLAPSEPATKQAVLEQAEFVLQANSAVTDNLNATVPQVFSIPALPLVMVKSYVLSGSIQPKKIFSLNATVINSGTGTAQNVRLELTSDESMTILGSEIVEVGELENGAETTVSWQIQVAEEPTVSYSVMRIQPISDNSLTMVEFIPVSISPLYGDVSGNKEITAYDASLILRVVVGILVLDDPNYPNLTLEVADVSGNGTVSALDAALVLQYTVGLITDFPRSLTGAPALDAESESKLLTEAIEQLEAVSLDREGQKVLESLKRLIAKQLRTADAVGLSTALFQNFPNPFNPETWIPFELAKDADVTISIYNVKGQLIRVLNLGNQKAGVYVSKDKATYWDGRDNFGEKVANGVYFYTLQVEPTGKQSTSEGGAGSFRMTRKMVILK